MQLENAALTLHTTEGGEYVCGRLIGFRLAKERYTPYSTLDVTAVCTGENAPSNIGKAVFSIGGRVVHSGTADSFSVCTSGGETRLRIRSRGFSAMLSQNETEPGLMTGVSLNSLMTGMPLPNITWQSDSRTVRYVYVKEHDSMWSVIVNLALSLNGEYPFVGGVNEVRLTPDGTVHTPQRVFETGETEDYSRIVSHYHMKDAQGNYTYNYTDGFAEARGIIRHKYIPYDQQFVGLDDYGLQYKLNFTHRGCRGRFVTYMGYDDEEPGSRIVFPNGTEAEISAVEVRGNSKKGIYTKSVCYYDRYCNK